MIPFDDTDDKEDDRGLLSGTTRSDGSGYLPSLDDGSRGSSRHLRRSVDIDTHPSRIDPFLGEQTRDDGSISSVYGQQRSPGEGDEYSDSGELGSEDGMSIAPTTGTSDAGYTDVSRKMTSNTVDPLSGLSTASYPSERKRRSPPRVPPLLTRPQPASRTTIHNGRTMFVRHQDAGMLGRGVDEVIDLPPLYTDVARSDPPRSGEHM